MENHLQPGMPLIGIKDNFRRSYRTACRLAGVEGVTPYAWRHLFGTDLHKAKIPPAIAMMIMGHTEDRTHRRYVNDAQRLAAQAAQELDDYRKKKAG